MNNACKWMIFLMVCGTFGCSDGQRGVISELAVKQQAIVTTNQVPGIYEHSVGAIVIQGHPQYPEQVVCSGAMISPKHMLTAAHCVAELSDRFALLEENESNAACDWTGTYVSVGATPNLPYMKVMFGNHLNAPGRSFHDIKKVTYHTGYSYIADANACDGAHFSGYETRRNDIAIIELSKPVSAEVATPMPILPKWMSYEDLINSEVNMTFLGYGTMSDGRKGSKKDIQMPISAYCGMSGEDYCRYDKMVRIKGCHPNRATCRKMGEQDYIDDHVSYPAGSFIYMQLTGGPCSGDSGGPAVVQLGRRSYIAGITSFGDSICRGYGVSTAVQDFYDWIIDVAPEAYDQTQYEEICNNGMDDDGNGKVDQDDPACEGQPYCGNGEVEDLELCDGDVFLNDLTECADWNFKYDSGKVKCNSKCDVDYSDCVVHAKPSTCGNGQIDEGEQCDGEILLDMYKEPMKTRQCSEFSSFMKYGTVSCNDNCMMNIEDCRGTEAKEVSICGDGIVSPTEMCDGDEISEGLSLECTFWDSRYISGKMYCTDRCTLSTQNCVEKDYCGDQQLGGNELCDGTLFYANEKSCREWSHQFKGGVVTCNSNCSLDYSGCEQTAESAAVCGNGRIDKFLDPESGKELMEPCDGKVFEESDECSDLDDRYVSGKVTCNSNCTLNFDRCAMVEDGGEFEDSNLSMADTLKTQSKPGYKVSKEGGVAVSFSPSDQDLMESVKFVDLKTGEVIKPEGAVDPKDPSERPSTDPADPEKPTDPEKPGSGEGESGSHGGCSGLPESSQGGLSVLTGLLLGGLLIRRREKTNNIR